MWIVCPYHLAHCSLTFLKWRIMFCFVLFCFFNPQTKLWRYYTAFTYNKIKLVYNLYVTLILYFLSYFLVWFSGNPGIVYSDCPTLFSSRLPFDDLWSWRIWKPLIFKNSCHLQRREADKGSMGFLLLGHWGDNGLGAIIAASWTFK